MSCHSSELYPFLTCKEDTEYLVTEDKSFYPVVYYCKDLEEAERVHGLAVDEHNDFIWTDVTFTISKIIKRTFIKAD